jgi:hypothetical protein
MNEKGKSLAQEQVREKQVREVLWKYLNFEEITDEEYDCVCPLNDILSNVGMSYEEINILIEMEDISNREFHKKFSMKDARNKLDSIPEELLKYKNPLLKALEAIDGWRGQCRCRVRSRGY